MFILATTNAHAGTSGNELLLGELDQLLKERITYVRKKENKINYLKQLSSSEASVDKKYDIISRLIEEYSNFQSDSAFQYIEQNRLLAGSLESKDKLLENRFQYIFLCAQAGLLNEAQHALLELEDQYPDMNMSQKAEYNKQYERLYMNLRELAQNSHLEEEYRRQELKYSRIICGLVPRESKDFYYYSFKQNYAEGNLEEAKKDIASYYQLIDSASNEAARALYHLSLIYKIEKDELNEEQSLICSVMADIKSAVKQNRSLRLLAQIRNDKGDIRRAYRYLDISLQDANFYNTRLRNSQIAEAIPIIQKEYQLQRDKQALYLWAGIVISTFFLLLILGIALYLRKKRKDLSVARSQLLSINDKLNRINCEVQEKNEELQSLTSNLMESDRVKEKYIGHFLKLCSMYILKIGDYQKLVNRKIKSGQIEELYKLNSSTQYLLKESKDFYSQFDEAFLQIYPSFVKELNALLKEDQQYTLKEGEFLNAELRICALIRLGIKDSSQIAEFMGYNPVTVYTYRTKVKSRAKDKNNFDQEILKIGSVHASS
ncbi:hypothetical protein DWW10_21895 [Bacteroides intestinalis]|uniref:DUF6377 domain-containing protein n=2 Tax=Bacteroides intestinalis TaxID=329854 RepID=A0A412XTM7_9BACE|nr:DUF6377 domain-containing protein [Bacteroides intestinalis]RGV48610.1 hypothetical protein DWW10_21895 [Bacteroides intestinalis]RHA60937.1 hypothetical protein DW932_08185 [Bacteroides intestinalis]